MGYPVLEDINWKQEARPEIYFAPGIEAQDVDASGQPEPLE